MRNGSWTCLFVLGCLSACVDGPTGADAATDGRTACATQADCSDGVFCNGIERCAPGTAGADARGCAPAASAACMAGQSCDEASARCRTLCAVTADADMDGATALECGGTDCDDADAHRFPGNAEVCDADAHDEDCDLDTIGARDADADAALDAACCNAVVGATPRCGTDCDDRASSVRPGQVESCNAVDDDCDGSVDETVSRTFFPDADHDGWGDSHGVPQLACVPPAAHVENALDCDDADGEVSPSGAEVCNMIDDDCDLTTDEPASASPACAATYGSPPHTRWTCEAGACAVLCPVGYDDCDGEPSNGCEAVLDDDDRNCGACGHACGIGGACTSAVCDEIVDVEAGGSDTCVVRSPSGRVVCWGANDFGQVGGGTFSALEGPTVVRDLEGITEIDLQRRGGTGTIEPTGYACALGTNVVRCWGGGRYGQLGSGTASAISATPVSVVSIPHIDTTPATVAHLSVGTWHACVTEHLADVGTGRWVAACWGRNEVAQIGAMPPALYATPLLSAWTVNSRGGVPLVAAGGDHTCVAWTDGSGVGNLECWGQITGSWRGVEYSEIESGDSYACGVSGGQVRCWTRTSAPAALPGVTTATHVSTGTNHICAVLADGAVTCWSALSPTAAFVIAGVSDAIDVSAGGGHACAVTRASEVYCWGQNYRGELGQPLTVTDTGVVPMRVPGI